MKKVNRIICLMIVGALVVGAAFGSIARRQGGAKSGPAAAAVRDAELEKDSLHNLDVARQYFKLKKAYGASLARCEEIIASNPNFARMDEALYIAGKSSLLLAERRGKQSSKIAPEKLRSDARDYLSRLVKEFPESQFRAEAQNDLQTLGEATKKQ